MIDSSVPQPRAAPINVAQATGMVDAASQGHATMPRHTAVGGNAVRLLVDAPNFMPALTTDIAGSQSLVDLRFFGWMPGGTGDQLAESVRQRLADARFGNKPPVEINGMVDKYGSQLYRRSHRDFFRSLENAGMNFYQSGDIGSPHDTAFRYSSDHGKLAGIDGRVVYGGGINPAGVYDPWHDLMVRVEGPGAAQGHLEYVARLADLGQPISDAHRAVILDALVTPQVMGDGSVKWLSNTPGGPKYLSEHVMQQIALAQRIDAETPYLGTSDVPDAFRAAEQERNAQVRFALPNPEGNEPKIRFNRTFYPEMIDDGVEVFEQQRMTHTKAVRTVNELGTLDMIMSLNFNQRSFQGDHEVGMAIRGDAKFERQMGALYEGDFASAGRIRASDVDHMGLKIGRILRDAWRIRH